MNKIKLKDVLKQYRETFFVKDDISYRQVTISQTGAVTYRGEKKGSKIGRKRQFKINLTDHPNTLIFIRQGVFKGGIGVIPPELDGCIATENMPMFEIHDIEPTYLINYIRSPLFKRDISKLVPMGTAQKAIHENKLLEIEIPLPKKQRQIEIDTKLFKLNKLNQIIETNLYSSNDLIQKLRQSILSDAVQGKLVPQNPNDEPASELLKKIEIEKNELIMKNKIKKNKQLKLTDEIEPPHKLPESWCWVRTGEVLILSEYGTSEKAFFSNNGIPVLGMGNIANGHLSFSNLKKLNETSKDLPKLLLKKNDLLFNRTNSYELVGKTGVYDKESGMFTFASYLIRLRFSRYILPKYANYYFMSSFFRKTQLEPEITQQTGQANFNGTKLKETLFPMPPISEQKLIVEKVDQLMKLCDELEEKVKENQKYSEQLMDAVLKEAFEVKE